MSPASDIKKRYPGFVLDMQLEAGEERRRWALPGCGKSCTLRCIAGGDARRGQDRCQRRDLFDSVMGINLPPRSEKCALIVPKLSAVSPT